MKWLVVRVAERGGVSLQVGGPAEGCGERGAAWRSAGGAAAVGSGGGLAASPQRGQRYTLTDRLLF